MGRPVFKSLPLTSSSHAGQAAWLIGEHLLLVHLESAELALLNAAGAALWLNLSNSPVCPTTLIASCARLFGVSTDRFGRDAEELLSVWRAKGWLTEGGAGRLQWLPRGLPSTGSVDMHDDPNLPETNWLFQAPVRIAGSTVHLRIGAGNRQTLQTGTHAWDTACRLVAQLASLPRGRGDDTGPLLQAVFTESGHVLIRDEAAAQIERHTLSDGTGALLSRLIHLSHRQCQPLAVLHAAAAALPGHGAILMPAVSGAGKSTLVTFLASAGWRYLGDDLVGLSAGGQVLALPTAASLKAGSWPLLEDRFPELASLPVMPYGSKAARHLPLTQASGTGVGSTDQLTAWVFPEVHADGPAHLEPLNELQALQLLLSASVGLGAPVSPTRVEALLALLSGRPRWRLRYRSLEDAAACLTSQLTAG